MIICYTVLQIWCVRAVIFIFHFGFWTIFDPFALLTAQKIKIKKKKNEKSTWRYYFTHVYQKLWWFLTYDAWQRDRQTDRWMEKVSYKGRCPT